MIRPNRAESTSNRRAVLKADGRAVAPVEVATTRRARGRGLLGRGHFDGALLLPGIRSVHTFGMRFAIDVALCDSTLRVVAIHHVRPGRLVLPRPMVAHVVETQAGRLQAWGVRPGVELTVAGSPMPGPGPGLRSVEGPRRSRR